MLWTIQGKKTQIKKSDKKQKRLKDEIQLIATALGTGDIGGKRRGKKNIYENRSASS